MSSPAAMICRGGIYHERLAPTRHAFRYPAFFCVFDLDRLAETSRNTRWFGYNRAAPASLYDRDYLREGTEPLAAKARALLAPTAPHRIRLITVPRVWGYVFNPVSFYLAEDQQGAIIAALAEVNNTFGERHVYQLEAPTRDDAGNLSFRSAKAFHVSPFNDRQGIYHFRVQANPERMAVHVDIERAGTVMFRSGLVSQSATPLNGPALRRTLLRYPLQNLATMPRIHIHAARLYFGKKMTYFPKPGPSHAMTIKTPPPNALEKTGKKVFFNLLRRINAGRMQVNLPDGSSHVFGPGGGIEATLDVTDYTFFRRILLDGDIGLGEAFMYGQWRSPDPTALIALLIINRDALQNGEFISARLTWLLNRIGHIFRSNSRKKSRDNIRAHYDFGNEFFSLFLDPTMLYSCAFYQEPTDTLEQAQRNKMRMLIEKAGIEAHHHVLEIGSGWGGFAIEMARSTGCRVTSITLSEEQLKFARQRVLDAGLEDRVAIELTDYRDVQGTYDRIVSIEMLEAVGHEHFDSFFQVLDRALVPDGRVALQTITIDHARYDAYRRSVDWIQKHIFPGGHLPSVEALKESMARCSGLMIKGMEDIGRHYTLTLRNWRENLTEKHDHLATMGCDEICYRTWMYYFHYCEAGFDTGAISNMHLVIGRE